MLQDLRENSQGIIAKVIVGFIIITFALWGVDSLVGLATGSGAPVKVNGVDISEQQILQGMELQRRQLLARMGENADPALIDETRLRQAVIERLIEETLLVESASAQGLAVGVGFIDQIILATKEFQVDGRFDAEQFNAMLRNAGLTPMSYRDLLRRETLIGQEQGAILNSAFVTEQQLNRLRALDQQTRSVRYMILPVEQALADVTVTETEVEQFYRDQQGRFVAPEQVALDYISLDLDRLAQQVEVSDADLQAAYDQLVAGFESEEVREAAHILVGVDGERDEKAARALAEQIKLRLDAGESFAALAKEFSDDTGSAASGGELGMVEKDVMVPEFEQALFAQQEGEVSGPVQTEFGFHLIKTLKVEHSAAPSFEQAQAGLRDELRQQRAEAAFVSKVEELADVSFSAADLVEPAQVMGLEIQSLPSFGREGDDSLLGSHPRVLEAAFSDDVLERGHNSAVIELSAQQAVVVRLREHLPSRQLELAEVRDQITAELERAKAAQQLKEKAEAIAAAERQGESQSVEWMIEEAVARSDQSLGAELVQELFRMPKPAEGAITVATLELADGSAAVLALTQVQEGDAAKLADNEATMIKAFLASRTGQYSYRAAIANRLQAAEVERL